MNEDIRGRKIKKGVEEGVSTTKKMRFSGTQPTVFNNTIEKGLEAWFEAHGKTIYCS